MKPFFAVRVIDVGTNLAGPYAATLMGEFGAEVLKVEHPSHGDALRSCGAPGRPNDSGLTWLSEARNKRSITLDLGQKEGANLLLRLVAKSDVLVENFGPDVLEGWGLSWEALRDANPGLVMLRVSAFGQTGPYRHLPGNAHTAHAVAGLSYLAGFPGESPLVPGTTLLGDYVSSLYGVIGVLLALRWRDATGQGQIVDIGVYEGVLRQMDELAAAYGLLGKIRQREGAGSYVAVPHGHFRTRDGQWIAIACTTDKMFERLADAMDRPELASPRLFGEQRKRLQAREDVDRVVSQWIASLESDQVMARCIEKDVPIGKLNSIADIFDDPHICARNNLVSVEEPGLGPVTIPGVVPTLSATPGQITALGPALGEATDQVLRALLDLTAAEIADLRERRII